MEFKVNECLKFYIKILITKFLSFVNKLIDSESNSVL